MYHRKFRAFKSKSELPDGYGQAVRFSDARQKCCSRPRQETTIALLGFSASNPPFPGVFPPTPVPALMVALPAPPLPPAATNTSPALKSGPVATERAPCAAAGRGGAGIAAGHPRL